ncbi:MAG: hypothetical protein M1550_04130 [Deltaproteobacteria bacterium]|nr:hypothetical protein [Deltaproteobacteria bacterium]
MAKERRPAPGNGEYVACPYCTMQVRAAESVCPHCRQAILPKPREGPRSRLPFGVGERWPALPALWERYGKWVKAAAPAVVGLLILSIVYGQWVKCEIHVDPNPALPVRVSEERKGNAVVLRGTVENRGEDVHELSLRSIGVVVEIVYRDGRRVKKTVFPKVPHRGEGTLLHGESGTFEIEVPAKDLKAVSFRSEVVDLGSERRFVQPFQRR